jgi:hypothetical protein
MYFCVDMGQMGPARSRLSQGKSVQNKKIPAR